MYQRFFAATLVAGLLANGASASLQNALSASLRLPAFIDPNPWPVEATELGDVLFADPANSTLDAPAYGPGPELRYNSATGDVTISAPPMLGTADEFGQRSKYSPVEITLHHSEHQGPNPRFPSSTIYSRNPLSTDDEPSFVASDPSGLSLYSQADSLQIHGVTSYRRDGWGGVVVTLDEWLSPLLAEGLFEPADAPVIEDPYYYGYRAYAPLAQIEAIITYEENADFYGYPGNQHLQLRAAAVINDQADTQESPVPEPSTLAAALLVFTILATRYRVTPQVPPAA